MEKDLYYKVINDLNYLPTFAHIQQPHQASIDRG